MNSSYCFCILYFLRWEVSGFDNISKWVAKQISNCNMGGVRISFYICNPPPLTDNNFRGNKFWSHWKITRSHMQTLAKKNMQSPTFDLCDRPDIQSGGAWPYKNGAAQMHPVYLEHVQNFAKYSAQESRRRTENWNDFIQLCQLDCAQQIHHTVDNSFFRSHHKTQTTKVRWFFWGHHGQV